jgi:hypothetical protein
MLRIKTYLLSRVSLLLFGVGIGLHQMWQAIQQNQLGAFLCGAGIFGFGIHWFLQPLILGKREGAERFEYENARLGSAGLSKKVGYAATGALLAGMLLRYAFHI